MRRQDAEIETDIMICYETAHSYGAVTSVHGSNPVMMRDSENKAK